MDDPKPPAVEDHWRYKPDQVRYEALLRTIFTPLQVAWTSPVLRWQAQLKDHGGGK